MTDIKIPGKRTVTFRPTNDGKVERPAKVARGGMDVVGTSRTKGAGKTKIAIALEAVTLESFLRNPFLSDYFDDNSLRKKLDECRSARTPFFVVEGPHQNGGTRLDFAENVWNLYLGA